MTFTVLDLSHYQSITPDLKAAAAAGVIGIIHKATEGATNKDEKCTARAWLAKDAGLLFGIYHFLRKGNYDKQLTNFLDVYNQLGVAGYEEMLLAIDYEDDSIPLADCAAFIKDVWNISGVKPILYSGSTLKEKVQSEGKTYGLEKFNLWLAQYSNAFILPKGWNKFWLWQYTDKGVVPGVSTCDINVPWEGTTLEKFKLEWCGSQSVVPNPVPNPNPVVTVIVPNGVRVVVKNE